MLNLKHRAGFIVCLLITLTAAHALAGENPFPRDWFWGDDAQRAKHDAMIGEKAPKMELSAWINGEQNEETLKDRIVVVDFWATWCGPCIRSIPHNNEMAKKYADQGVTIMGICGSANGQEKMEEVAKEKQIAYPVAKDHTQKAAKSWNVMWWPTYAVVDRNNVIRAVGLKPSHVENVVDKILEEQPYEEKDDATADSDNTPDDGQA